MKYVAKRDLLLHYPYHSFDHFIHFCMKPFMIHRSKKS